MTRRTDRFRHRNSVYSIPRSEPPQTVVARIPLGAPVSDVATNPLNSVAYAALRDSIAVINSRHEVAGVIPVGGQPRTLSIGADGGRLYATHYGGSVSVIDISDHRVDVIAGACCMQQVDTADGALIYAAGNATGGAQVTVIGEGGATIAAFDGFAGCSITDMAADPDPERVYLGLSRRSTYHQYDRGWLGVVDVAAGGATRSIDLVGAPDTISLSPDGSTVYATHYDHGCVSAIDLLSLDVTRIALDDNPIDVTFTPDSLQAYVTGRNSLTVIDTVAGEVARIAAGDLPRSVRTSPDGKYAYVSNFGGRSLSVIDTITQGVIDRVDVGGYPEALALNADGDLLYVGDYWSGAVTVLSVQH